MGVTAMIAPGVPGTEVSIEMLGLLPGKSLRGVIQGDSVSKTFIPKLIDLWQRGQFPFDELITEYHGIDNLNAAAQAMSKGEVIKPVVILDAGAAS
jgi:aryl-alcohol dehydrogenase